MMFSAILVLSTLAYSSYAVPILSASNAPSWSNWNIKWPSYSKAEEQVAAAKTSKLILDSMLNSKKGENKDEAKVREQFFGNLFDNIPSPLEETDKVEEQQTFDLSDPRALNALLKYAMNQPSNKRQNADAARDQFFPTGYYTSWIKKLLAMSKNE